MTGHSKTNCSIYCSVPDSPQQRRAIFCSWSIHRWSWPSGPNWCCCRLAVHEQSPDNPLTIPWWLMTVRGLSTTGCRFCPFRHWTVLEWSMIKVQMVPGCPNCPVMVRGLLPLSTGVLRMTRISGDCLQNTMYFYINSCTLHHPHSLHRGVFIEISTWTWTMLCFKCRMYIQEYASWTEYPTIFLCTLEKD